MYGLYLDGYGDVLWVQWVVQLRWYSWRYGTEISLTYESRHDIDSRSNDESLRESIHSCAGLTFIGYNS